ncbi:OrdA protein, partial [Hymenopellis radicata]
PPGPHGWPLIGNIYNMPKTDSDQWRVYAAWGRKYGPICSLNLMGQPMIIVNSSSIIEELDKKGATYSNRPHLEMAGELMGHSNTVVLLQHNTRFRNFRRHIAKLMGTGNAIVKYHPMIEGEMRRHLKRVLAHPEQLDESLRKTAGGIILKVTYGIDVKEEDDPFVNLIHRSNTFFINATTPGAFLVDVFPILRFLPDWMPGAGFKRLAKEGRKLFDDVVDVPFAFTQAQMTAGNAPPSFIANSLENEDELNASELLDIKHTATSLYGAGADTTVSAQMAFYLAMILRPDVQAKAQSEIDSVVGRDRLPTLEIATSFRIFGAIVTEVLRWNPVAPLGFPHTASEDGLLGGYYIPKGAMIITNLWQMLHDPEVYPDPFAFEPSRHLGDNKQKDPRHACFGYARRYCAGSHMAEAAVFICIAMTLSIFDITSVVEDGVPVIPVHEQTSGTVSHPKPFKYSLKPRSENSSALVSGEAL